MPSLSLKRTLALPASEAIYIYIYIARWSAPVPRVSCDKLGRFETTYDLPTNLASSSLRFECHQCHQVRILKPCPTPSQVKRLVSKVTFKGKVGVLNDVGLNRILHAWKTTRIQVDSNISVLNSFFFTWNWPILKKHVVIWVSHQKNGCPRIRIYDLEDAPWFQWFQIRSFLGSAIRSCAIQGTHNNILC